MHHQVQRAVEPPCPWPRHWTSGTLSQSNLPTHPGNANHNWQVTSTNEVKQVNAYGGMPPDRRQVLLRPD